MSLRALMIAYYYPPRGGGGTQRTVKFAKYLPEYNIDPVILTSGEMDKKIHDKTLERAENIIQVPNKEPGRLASRFYEHFRHPDIYAPWIEPASRAALEYIKKNKVDVIYSTASPYVGHAVAQRAALESGLPWIADFRDLWTNNALYKAPNSWIASGHKLLEHDVFEQATHILCTSDQQKEFTLKQSELGPNNVSVITNGYDAQDFQYLSIRKKGLPLQLLYLGSFYGEYRPDDFILALRFLEKKDHQLHEKIQVTFVGDYDRATLSLFGHPELKNILTRRAYVPHSELQTMRDKASVYFLYLPQTKKEIGAMIPQKVFEYLADRKPIFAIVPEYSDVANILRKSGGAHIAMPGNALDIAKEITKLIKSYDFGSLTGTTADLSQYERKYLTGQLASLIKKVADDK